MLGLGMSQIINFIGYRFISPKVMKMTTLKYNYLGCQIDPPARGYDGFISLIKNIKLRNKFEFDNLIN
jgi:hypothetical protein